MTSIYDHYRDKNGQLYFDIPLNRITSETVLQFSIKIEKQMQSTNDEFSDYPEESKFNNECDTDDAVGCEYDPTEDD